MDSIANKTLLEELIGLLRVQIDHLRKKEFVGAEKASKKADETAARIGELRLFELPDFGCERAVIVSLYDELSLVLNQHKQQTEFEMDKVSTGKKAIGVYQSAS